MNRSLRFCMITTFYPPYNFGGDGIFVYRLSNALAKLGHDVTVIHCIDSYRLADRGPVDTVENHPRVTVHGIRSPAGFLSPLATQQTGHPFFKAEYIRRILETGFDVIHYHNISLVGGPGILLYGRGIKLWTLHEYWFVCPTHVLFRYNRTACTERHCFLCSLAYRRPPQWWRRSGLMTNALKHVDAAIVPSRFSEEIHRRGGLTLPITHLPHFVVPEAGDDKPSQAPYFLFVGRLEKLKGAQTLVSVFSRFNKAQLWIVGKGTYAASLERECKGNSNIRLLGHVGGKDLMTLYRNAIAVIVPSLCFETFAQVIVEAFTQKTPAIVRNLGAMPEIIQQSGGGFIYNTDEELLAAMEKLASDASLRTELGSRGFEAYQKTWNEKVHLDAYLSLISDLRPSASVHSL